MKHLQRHYAVMIVGYVILHALFFSPVIFADRLLAPGDAAVYYLPTFLSPRTLWEPNIWGGYPVAADQQTMTWYPLALLFSFLPHAWNLYVLSAYVLASCFTYAYVYQLTRSALAGFVAGTIYGLSGFMVAHLGHTTMIHNAAWLPLVIWSFENLRQRLSARWMLAGAAAIALSALAGHSQIFAYTLCLAGAYAALAGWRAPAGRWRFYAASFAITMLGIGLAGVQLVPAIELGRASWRAQSSFAEFVTYRSPVRDPDPHLSVSLRRRADCGLRSSILRRVAFKPARLGHHRGRRLRGAFTTHACGFGPFRSAAHMVCAFLDDGRVDGLRVDSRQRHSCGFACVPDSRHQVVQSTGETFLRNVFRCEHPRRLRCRGHQTWHFKSPRFINSARLRLRRARLSDWLHLFP
ncbi:MAG: hypothetical protein WKF30_00010 [Pyrinomonadaceae bacterium]